MKIVLHFTTLCLLFAACNGPGPNLNEQGQDVLEVNQTFLENIDASYRDTVYVPIYSDIYSESKHTKFNLTATLSIRNTSLTDTIYIEDIDYYDTDGHLVRHYLQKLLLLRPLQSFESEIE